MGAIIGITLGIGFGAVVCFLGDNKMELRDKIIIFLVSFILMIILMFVIIVINPALFEHAEQIIMQL